MLLFNFSTRYEDMEHFDKDSMGIKIKMRNPILLIRSLIFRINGHFENARIDVISLECMD